MLILPLVSFLFLPGTPYVPDRPFAVDLRCMQSLNPQRLNKQGMSTQDFECRDGKWVPRVPTATPVPDDKCTRYHFAGLIPEGSVCDRNTGKIRAWNPPEAWPYPVNRTCTQIALTPDAHCNPLTGSVTTLNPAEQDRWLNFCNQPASGCRIITDATSTKADTEPPYTDREDLVDAVLEWREQSAERLRQTAEAQNKAAEAQREAANEASKRQREADKEARDRQAEADSSGQEKAPDQEARPGPAAKANEEAQAARLAAQKQVKVTADQADQARTQYGRAYAAAENRLRNADARLALVLAKLPVTPVPGGTASGKEQGNTVEIRIDQLNPLVLYKSRYPGDLTPFNSRSPVALKYLDTGTAPESTLMLPELADALHVLALRVRLYNPLWTLKIDETYIPDLKGPLPNGQVLSDDLKAFLGNRHPDGRSADVSIVSRGTVLNNADAQGILAGLVASVGFNYVRNDVSSDPELNRVYLSINWPARWIPYRDARLRDPDTQRMLRARAGIPEPIFGQQPVPIQRPAPQFPAQVLDGLKPGQILSPRR